MLSPERNQCNQRHKIELESLMSHRLVYRFSYYVFGSGNISVVVLCVEGQKALRFQQTYLNLCSKMNKGLTGLEQHEGE